MDLLLYSYNNIRIKQSMQNYNSQQQIFIVINAFLLLFIFIAGGLNKVANFQDTVTYLETKINEIQLNPIFITSVIVTIFYFYLNIYIQRNSLNTFLFSSIVLAVSVAIIGIPFLVYFKKYLNQNCSKAFVSLIYDTAILGVIGLLTLGSAVVMYSLYTNSYQEYAYAATIGLAAFTAMTILIFNFPTNKEEVISFTKNLSILGGLMLLSQRFV
jgi:uncharacterized membrane protein YphA (DoxX/SURF4 family)